ncbi:MAG TPA: recombinase family protein [Candidatus Sulfotelmatobacter sp.]|nr:recombinase family protein [Candidatus Sulfotelmatobacter sp.]
MEKKYYLIYCRKSEESEDRQVQSIGDQLNAAEELKVYKNLITLETFTESKSAKKPGRTEFNRMIDLIHERRDIKGIIVWKLNRLSRNPKDEGTIRWLLQSGEIEEIVTPEKTYKMVDSDFIMAIEGAQAQRFINDLRKDTARGVQSKIDKGIAPMLAPPGYRNAVEKKQGEKDIQPHPLYFSLMKQIFEIFLTGHYSVEQLYKKVEEMKIKNSRNQIVSRTQLYKALRDPFYTGTRFIYGKKLHTNGIHEPMINDEQFDLIQEILLKRSRPRVNIHKGFLNGIVRCGECGSMITAEVHRKKYKNGKTQEFSYYRCTKRRRGTKCLQPYISVEKLDEQAIIYLKSTKLSTPFVEWAIKWLNVMHHQQQEIKESKLIAIQQEYNETDKKIANLVDLMISGIVTPKEGAVKKQELEAEKNKLFGILSKIDAHATEWTNLTIQTFDFVKTAQDKFEFGTIEQKKTILKVIGSNLVLKDKKLDIEVRTPFIYIQKVVAEINGNKKYKFDDLPDSIGQKAFLGSNQSIVGG